MMNGLVGISRRSGAMTVAGWPRRCRMRSAIVSSSALPPLALPGSVVSSSFSTCSSASLTDVVFFHLLWRWHGPRGVGRVVRPLRR
eukprot:2318743-Pleurochrysis_carterae.AAC.3